MSLIALGSLSACGTLTGIPAHGGGKRFSIEQHLVSACSNTDGNSTNTSTGLSTGTSNANRSDTNTAKTTNSGYSSGSSTTSRLDAYSGNGGNCNRLETIASTPTEILAVIEGTQREHTATLQYRGLGEYQNLAVPNSDASPLIDLVRNHVVALLLQQDSGLPLTSQRQVAGDKSIPCFGIVMSQEMGWQRMKVRYIKCHQDPTHVSQMQKMQVVDQQSAIWWHNSCPPSPSASNPCSK